jgi:hypothetical protein
MNNSMDIESEILQQFDQLREKGVLHVGLLLSDEARAQVVEHLSKTQRIAVTNTAQGSRLSLMAHFSLPAYPGPGYRVGPLDDVSREWRGIWELEIG